MSAESPLVTVVMAVKNGGEFLRQTVDGILGQAFTDFRFLAVNDGSSDQTGALLHSYADPRLEVIDLAESVGVARARNQGLALAASPLVALTDGDDVSRPERLAKQVATFERDPRLVLLGSAYERIDEQGRSLGVHQTPTDPTRIRFHMIFSNCYSHSTAMFRLEPARRAGLSYDKRFPPAEDYDFFARLVELGLSTNLTEPLVQYRQHGQMATIVRGDLQLRNAMTIRRQNLARLGLECDDEELELLTELFHDFPSRLSARQLPSALMILAVLRRLEAKGGVAPEVIRDLRKTWAGRILGGVRDWGAWAKARAWSRAMSLDAMATAYQARETLLQRDRG